LPPGAAAVLNLDDPGVLSLARELPQAAGFSVRGQRGARFVATDVRSSLTGVSFEVLGMRVRSPLVGAHNVENLLAAIGLLVSCGVVRDRDLPEAVAAANGAPGRLERVADPAGRIVLVDYAHTDDALARVLDAVRAAGAPRIVCVFGCGGDRDRGKRPLMGRAAAARAELVVATSDNPRTEDPLAILAEIEPALAESRRKLTPRQARSRADGYAVVPDRREAIGLALASARPGDAVLIAGKGHEDYQIVGTRKLGFDDRAEARLALEALR
jgi:UDP-N-acetylmuramoyl-L-alanyl-D-glutamate--2,6-diaminopimelate ligase